MALAGGRTPAETYRILGAMRLPWHAVFVFQTDERLFEADPERRTAAVIETFLIRPSGIPSRNWYSMPAAPTIPLPNASRQYASRLLAHRPDGRPDVVVLGLGDDGHTASLFASSGSAMETTAPVALSEASPGDLRMTLTLAALRGAVSRLMLATGDQKSRAVAELTERRVGFSAASRILESGGQLLIDAAAGSRLSSSRSAGPPEVGE